ncbi:MAG: rod shape-determining protein MreD [Gammaproteobacteria bacterium]
MFSHIYWLVFLTFVFSLCLDAVMVPDWAVLWWPEWTALTTVFWVFTAPRHFGVVAAWMVGLLSDVLHAQPFGQHALAFAVLAYVSYLVHLRVRVFPLWQQCITVFVLLGIGQMVQRTVAGLVGVVTESWWYYLPVVSGALLWPFILPLLHGIRRRWVVTESERSV